MANCLSSKQEPKQKQPLPSTKLYPQQTHLLRLMYKDLASRSKDNHLTREVFDTFFHLNGLWGQQMFRQFDKSRQGSITFSEFASSIDLMVKGSFSERCKILFDFYDVDQTNGISYNQLIRMVLVEIQQLSSYSKQDLKQMLTEEKFVTTLSDHQCNELFGPQNQQFREKQIIQQQVDVDDQQQLYKKKLERVGSEYVPSSSQCLELTEKLRTEFQKIMKQKNQNPGEKRPTLQRAPYKNTINKQSRRQKINRKIGSMADIPTYKRSKYKLTSNITFLVKKYGVYIFKQLNLDKNKDSINFKQFQLIISREPKIFCIYFQGFHSYVWLHDYGENGELAPEYETITPWIESETLCIDYIDGDRNCPEQHKLYLKYIRTTMFICKKKNKGPIQVKHMQGLLVEQVQNQKKINKNDHQYAYGIVIKHRDGIYPQKQYYFKDQQLQKQWLKILAEFKSNSIYNQYRILDKIGTGNFSSVYRGVQKTSKNQQLKQQEKQIVAVKVIEKFKLSPNQNQVIKFQCKILGLCHHPNIVKFHKHYHTRTRLYIVTEYLGEGDLFQYTKKNVFLEEYQAAIILKQLIEAVHYLNRELGLIHRDLKPQNVMITTKQCPEDHKKNQKLKTTIIHRVKLIDFGFAIYKSNLKNLSKKEKFAGSPGFIAPQIFTLQDYDESIDMFSLGIILYFMLYGHLPFSAPTYEHTVQLTKQCNIQLSSAHWMNVSDEAKDLLLKILTFRDKRISTKQALEHPWFKDIDKLKGYAGRNKKNRYL